MAGGYMSQRSFWVAVGVAVCLATVCVAQDVLLTFTNNLSVTVDIYCSSASEDSGDVPLDPGQPITLEFTDKENPITCTIDDDTNFPTSTIPAFNPGSDAPGNFQIDINTNSIDRNGTPLGTWSSQ